MAFFILFVGLLFTLVVGKIFVGVYNALVDAKNQVDRAWANVDVILEQRLSELPKIITMVEQFSQNDHAYLDKIIAAREQLGKRIDESKRNGE